MSDANNDVPVENRNLAADLVIPVAGILFTLYYFSTILDSPWTAQVSAFSIGSILLLLCTVFVIKTVVIGVRGHGYFRMDALFSVSDIYNGRLALFGLTVMYTIAIDYGGFTITTFMFLALAMLVLNKGRNKLGIAIMSGVMALGGWALFIYAFDTRFPRGPFEHMMRALLPEAS